MQSVRLNAGMTLVEVLVALSLLVIGIAGGYTAISASMKNRQFAHNYYLGTLLANNQIERAKNLPFAQLTLLRESNVAINEEGSTDSQGRFRRTTSVTTSWGSNPNESKIDVSVSIPLPLREGFTTSTVSTILVNIQ